MTFREAHNEAIKRSASFRRHDAQVKEAMANGTASACMIFTLEGETFYYGFDGVDLIKGKHTKKRSEHLIRNEETLIIL